MEKVQRILSQQSTFAAEVGPIQPGIATAIAIEGEPTVTKVEDSKSDEADTESKEGESEDGKTEDKEAKPETKTNPGIKAVYVCDTDMMLPVFGVCGVLRRMQLPSWA